MGEFGESQNDVINLIPWLLRTKAKRVMYLFQLGCYSAKLEVDKLNNLSPFNLWLLNHKYYQTLLPPRGGPVGQ